MNKAIFLDRDGTINKLIKGQLFVNDTSKIELIDGVKKALQILKNKGYLLIVITNQTGVGAGYYTKEEAENVNKKIEELLGFQFDAIYSCYHHPDDLCNCRKPAIGNIEKAVKDFNIDVTKSYMVGDKEKDVLAGINIACKATCLLSDNKNIETKADYVCKNLLEFVNKIT